MGIARCSAWAVLGSLVMLSDVATTPSCSDNAPKYRDVPGTATIVTIEPAPATEYNCPNDPVRVTFNFVADDPTLGGNPGMWMPYSPNPSREYVRKRGITVGSQWRCVRADHVSGGGSPVVWRFVDEQTSGTAVCVAAPAGP